MTNSHVLEIWREKFEEIHRFGGLFNLVRHPQVDWPEFPSQVTIVLRASSPPDSW
jgi:hypothetical protein